jgi:Ca-activated chloride channel family protein
LVKQSLHLLLDELRPSDRVALVTYAGNTAVILKSTPASDKATIKAAIDQLGAGGGTAGASGIQLAYSTARTNFMEQGNNRVILCTDGDFNIGQSSEKELVDLIDTEKKSGVYLTVLGFGTGNYQDGKMQELADRGNGNHAYIDQIGEAKKVLVKEFAGTLFTIAKDVKLQLEFNPDQVSSYRLIGYENRMLAKEDFDNDAKDAGELGAGHTVTALYEIIPNVQSNQAGDLVKLKFRYKPPTGEQASLLVEKAVPAVCAAKMSDNFNFASAVAEFGLLLRNSAYKGTATWKQVISNASNGLSKDSEGYRAEFVGMVKKVEGLK